MSNPPPEERPRPKPLSEHPSVEAEQLRAQALLDAYGAGSAAARQRFAAHHPRFARDTGTATARAARLVIAREYGFANWQPSWRRSASRSTPPVGWTLRPCTAVRQQWNPQGDFPAVVRLLLQAGAHLPEDLYPPTGQAAIDELLIDPRREPYE